MVEVFNMKKKYFLISLVLLGFLIVSIYSNNVFASDEGDDDNINDDFEELNKRIIEIYTEGNETLIESIRRSDTNKDEIRGQINYNEEGLKIELRYRSDLESECELEFGILFRQLIEYIDINQNGIYEPEIDQKIQNMSLNEFRPLIYESMNISRDTKLHYIKVQTENEIFIAHIYFVEEFATTQDNALDTTATASDLAAMGLSYAVIGSAINQGFVGLINFWEGNAVTTREYGKDIRRIAQ